MVGVWEGLNLGSIPNDHMPSQKYPKNSFEMRCSTILHKKAAQSFPEVTGTENSGQEIQLNQGIVFSR